MPQETIGLSQTLMIEDAHERHAREAITGLSLNRQLSKTPPMGPGLKFCSTTLTSNCQLLFKITRLGSLKILPVGATVTFAVLPQGPLQKPKGARKMGPLAAARRAFARSIRGRRGWAGAVSHDLASRARPVKAANSVPARFFFRLLISSRAPQDWGRLSFAGGG
jgi:hypothetical protein